MWKTSCFAQKGPKLKLGGNIGALITKCIVAIECLNWKEIPHYFSNSSTHWSPWGPILQWDKLNTLWLETTRQLNNKGGIDLVAFWDQRKMEWSWVLDILREGPLSVDEVVLLGRIEDRLATIWMPIGTSVLDWKGWC